eukprot:365396-Chlamydomonas_euryale.AAC.1
MPTSLILHACTTDVPLCNEVHGPHAHACGLLLAQPACPLRRQLLGASACVAQSHAQRSRCCGTATCMALQLARHSSLQGTAAFMAQHLVRHNLLHVPAAFICEADCVMQQLAWQSRLYGADIYGTDNCMMQPLTWQGRLHDAAACMAQLLVRRSRLWDLHL